MSTPGTRIFEGEGFATDCRQFTGFSPCRHRRSCPGCPHYDPVHPRVLLIQLDALGDVLRTTPVLPAIRRKHPKAHITWLTRREAAPLLAYNPLVDRVLILGDATAAVLSSLEFDLALCPEKSVAAGALMRTVKATEQRGFSVDAGGAIVPLNPEAEYLYRLGLDNEEKFFVNEQSEQQLVTEALGFEYKRDRYIVVLDDRERGWARQDRRNCGVEDDEVLIGWNTGCGPRYPYKRLEVDDQVAVMRSAWRLLPRKDKVRFALLGGGREDAARNKAILQSLTDLQVPAVATPCNRGLRRGLSSVAACDVVVSGDSLALHMGIGLKKPVIAWFGITCHQEIDMYGRGIRVLSKVPCRPCWLQSCHLEPKCYQELPWGQMASCVVEVAMGILRDGAWTGDRVVGQFPPANRVGPPLGISPGPIL